MNPMFYQNPVVLNKKEHKDWKIEAVEDYTFAKKTNSVYLMSAEFVLASKVYPIIFIRNDNAVVPIALLSLQEDNNQFVAPKGKGAWNADYIPAYVRRYPFIPANKKDGEKLILCIDSEYKGLNSRKAKQSLFDKDGKPDVVVKKAVNLLESYNVENKKTIDFCKIIDDLGLFENAQVEDPSLKSDNVKLTGFLHISHKKFTELNTEKVKSLFDSGALEFIYAHFQSLVNLKNLD